jgi:ABC-2 type transport system ATP-binding protein
VDDLARDVLGGAYSIEVDASGIDVPTALKGLNGVAAMTKTPRGTTQVDAKRDVRADIAKRIIEKGGALREMTLRRASLDDVYARYFAGRKEIAHAA